MSRYSFKPTFGRTVRVLSFALLGVFTGCQSVYYGTMEKFGLHKRDMLVDRVEDAKDSQGDAKEQFANALEEFLSVTKYEGDDLKVK